MSILSTTDPVSDDECPKKRHRQLPSRFRGSSLELHDTRLRDVLPQPPPALPPPGMGAEVSAPQESSQMLSSSLSDDQDGSESNPSRTQPTGLASGLRKTLETARNSFGLFRCYFACRFPSHDPESEVGMLDLSDILHSRTERPASSSYDPYPNQSTFRLGNWYWNHGVQKSQMSFRELIGIIGDVDFQPSDVRSTNWEKINKLLADGGHDEGEGKDEDAGWKTLSVSISVPFHRYTSNPGPQEYVVTNFHHRPLVSVIREKLANETDAPHFHYEPYELLWRPSDDRDPVRIHSELYTSPAFMDAHNALQDMPGEPNCELPRVLVALMFWSDGTQLTNFGDAKLWLLYMFFGNESKYRRGKPSCHLCEHVAYFESVRHIYKLIFCSYCIFSYQIPSGTLSLHTQAGKS